MINSCLLVVLVIFAEVEAKVNFLAIGDWGGEEFSPYTTKAEVDTSKQMANTASLTDTKFVLALGDNFYLTGVLTADSIRFLYTFEKVFSASSLQCPWHVIAGNHDHYGNVQAQIDYSKKSSRWNFPSLYYTFSYKDTDGTTLDVVMIDTVVLAGNSITSSGDLPGSALKKPPIASLADAQLQWINSTLASSTADYLIVAGHYPVWSICEHGPTKYLVDNVKPLLEKYHVSAYLAGHDHCAEYLVDPNDSAQIQYHGVGAAHGCDDSTAHSSAVPQGSLKFHWAEGATRGAYASVSFDSTGLVVKHMSDDGTVLFTAPSRAPRKFNR
eukprot:NODE_4294_length_1192_cov_42.990645_g3789_i0.p1 GENE.NODE_4294_length_1192_cov_42.990645_g3789_i0~~NODE_4294_length_1192_cov_42.990645_g3789_i0.p1  ORF type:complete len:327 (+),score=50.53 NODE_4294_length_1192_cov_42.990645_g3789_i0:39-1019(+)